MDAQTRLEPLLEGLERLHLSEDYADLEIVCQGHQWKVHKLCVCAQSEFFQKACSGNFSEAKNNKIELDDEDPETVKTFIHYLYHFDYYHSTSSLSALVLDVRIYLMADKYFVAPLKELAAEKFKAAARSFWDEPVFAEGIAEVYQSTTAEILDPLKRTILRVVKQHRHTLLDASKDKNHFLEMLGSNAEFGRDLAVVLANPTPQIKSYDCPSCGKTFTAYANTNWLRCPYSDACGEVQASFLFT